MPGMGTCADTALACSMMPKATALAILKIFFIGNTTSLVVVRIFANSKKGRTLTSTTALIRRHLLSKNRAITKKRSNESKQTIVNIVLNQLVNIRISRTKTLTNQPNISIISPTNGFAGSFVSVNRVHLQQNRKRLTCPQDQ